MVRFVERSLFSLGALALLIFVYAYGEPRISAGQSIRDFSATKILVATSPDMALWSPERINAYQAAEGNAAALGVLNIKRLAIVAPIYAGTADEVLDRGIGWIEGTASMSGMGNVGLAAHRDGFFRALKDVVVGDEIVLETLHGVRSYRVSGTDIVTPEETYVLEPTNSQTLTLVTCYPFYFVGSAPERFVVFATLANDA